MTTEEAEALTRQIATVWGVDRGDTWIALYAAHLKPLDHTDALRALMALFGRCQFCPTPQQFVEEAAGLTTEDAHTALAEARMAMVRNQALDGAARRALLDVFGSMAGVPLDGPLSRQQADMFSAAWRRHRTAEIQGDMALPEATRKALTDGRP